MITIIDYNTCNVGSISNMLRKLGHESKITNDLSEINESSKLILPGVGSFDKGMQNLEDLGIGEVIKNRVKIDKIPILGICLGMQLLTKRSDEGIKNGLNLIDAETLKFKSDNLRIPHMGWNHPIEVKKDDLFQGLAKDAKFYFVHSYFVKCNNEQDVSMVTNYSSNFASAFQNQNIYGVQFHPEKSHKHGMIVLNNFAKI